MKTFLYMSEFDLQHVSCVSSVCLGAVQVGRSEINCQFPANEQSPRWLEPDEVLCSLEPTKQLRKKLEDRCLRPWVQNNSTR
jgi:hypothetical protein